jgi:hypothetical protein
MLSRNHNRGQKSRYIGLVCPLLPPLKPAVMLVYMCIGFCSASCLFVCGIFFILSAYHGSMRELLPLTASYPLRCALFSMRSSIRRLCLLGGCMCICPSSILRSLHEK